MRISGEQVFHCLNGVNTRQDNAGKFANKMDLLLLINFRPGGLYPFLPMEQSQLLNQHIGLNDINQELTKKLEENLLKARSVNELKDKLDAVIVHIDYNREAPKDSDIVNTNETKNYIMHSDIVICGTHFSMSDTLEKIEKGNMYKFNAFMQSEDAVKKAYHLMKETGTVVVELGSQFFSSLYGYVIDRFGVHWRFMIKE